MKREDLTVGAELFYARRWEWQNHQGCRATVLAVEPYERNRSVLFSGKLFRPTTKGQGVHVRLHTDDPYNPDQEDVVPLSALRGPWAEIEARSVELRKIAKERRNQQRADNARQMERQAEAIRKLALLGVQASSAYGSYDALTLTVDMMEKLLTLRDEHAP